METLLQRVNELVRARYPLIYLLTHEEGRVERGLVKFGKTNNFRVFRWRSSEGLRECCDNPQLLPSTLDLIDAFSALDDIKEPALFLFADLSDSLCKPSITRAIRDRIDSLGSAQQAILITSPSLTLPTELETETIIVDVPLPSEAEISRLLLALVRRAGIALDPALQLRFVKAAAGLTEREIKRALSRVANGDGGFSESDIQSILESKEQTIRRTKFLELYTNPPKSSEVGGLGNLKQWLNRRSKAFEPAAREYGLPQPNGLFMLGVQGCGKSLMAKAVSSIFQIPLLRLDVAEVFRGDGRHQESLQETIKIAESISPAILWIDELEKAFGTTDASSGRALGVLLTWLQEKTKPVYVVATANEVRNLPPELLRKGRFDEIFFVDLPDVHERLEILQIHLDNRDIPDEELDLLQCAEETEKYSGAELEQIVIEALFESFHDGARPVATRDLLNAIRHTVPLAITMDEQLKELREWARPRTRPASLDRRRIDFFEDFLE